MEITTVTFSYRLHNRLAIDLSRPANTIPYRQNLMIENSISLIITGLFQTRIINKYQPYLGLYKDPI